MKRILFFIIILTTFSSCKMISSLAEMKKTKAKIYSYNIDNKEIKFLPMHHLGKKEFYDDVKQKVISLKQNGFVVYYELISTNVNLDSLQKDTLRRKYRKIKGFSGTYKEVTQDASMFKKYIQQPSYPDLGTTETDKRADINAQQFVEEWEKQNGKIVLDSLDLNTPFDTKFERGNFYTKEQYNNVILKYRNQYVSDLIKTSNDNKILILYGKGHRKDLIKRLKEQTK